MASSRHCQQRSTSRGMASRARCAPRFAGVWDGKIYQVGEDIHANVSDGFGLESLRQDHGGCWHGRPILPSPIAPPPATAAPCPLCLGALQCASPMWRSPPLWSRR